MRIELQGDNYDIGPDVEKYVNKKINKLNKHMSKHLRQSAHMQVFLKQQDKDASKKYLCEMILRLPPREEMVAKEATVNMFAAVDIAEAKIDAQLRKYRDKHSRTRNDRKGALQKMRRLADRDYWGKQN